jgi:transposase-like protein
VPRAGEFKHPKAIRDKAIKRHLEGGESVEKLAKYYKVTRQTLYSWLDAYKQSVLHAAERAGMSPADLEKRSKTELVAENMALKAENRKLRDRLVTMLMKTGDL